MQIILVSVIFEVGLISYHDAFIQFVTEDMSLSLIAANTIFGTACIFVTAPALYYYRSELLGWFKSTSSVFGKPEPNTVHTQAPMAKAYTLRTLEEILESIDDCTNIQIPNIVRPHIGKWLKVNEEVYNVTEFEDKISVYLDLDRDIHLRFKKRRWKATLETMKKGDRVIAEGKIISVEKNTIKLGDCELQEVKPRERLLSRETNSNIDPNKCDEK